MKRQDTGRHITFVSAVLLVLSFLASVVVGDNGNYRNTPHGSRDYGVLRTNEYPRGSCAQCHTSHFSTGANPFGLFRENSNEICFSASQGGCHADRPSGGTSGYPAQEADRLPNGSSDPGYFEYSAGGQRVPGLANRVRWPGRTIWEDALNSTHFDDPNMPLKDAYGHGSCDNCHSPHGGISQHDMLDTTYSGIAGSQIGSSPDNYALCLKCHSITGPTGMREASRNIAYYFDRSINPGSLSGHGIRSGGAYVPSGSRLPCYDCHNAHGSTGNGGAGPNKFLLSDQRPGWYGLTDITNDASQVRRFCFGCHKSSDNVGGGTVEGMTLAPLPNTIGAHASTATNHCYDCHGRDYTTPTSNNIHNPSPGGDCVGCHATARGTRRPIVPEFGQKGHHGIRIGQTGTITNRDCIVCHMEGSATTGQPDGAYHANGTIELRNPDDGTPLTGFVSFTRDRNSSVLEPWVTDVQNNFCLKCHDANGAMSSAAQAPGGTAQTPFVDQQARVIDVASQLASTNSSYHPVVAPGTNPFEVPSLRNNNARLMLPPFNQVTHDVISCFDCHETSGHGSPNTGMLVTETYFRDVNPNANFGPAQRTFCTRCHDPNVYTQSASGSRFHEHTVDDHANNTGGSSNAMSCRGCHAGIYNLSQVSGCDNGSGIGRIHGYTQTYGACSPTVGSRAGKFLFGGYLKGWRFTDATHSTCYANCHHPDGQDY
jgi:predicted CXXCH cytochrome family protein